jgi:predicted Zn-dependent peptidase
MIRSSRVPRSRPTAFPAAAALALALAFAPAPAPAQDLAAFEARTTVHVLDNGWTFIICERPVAPVFSFATVANVGSAQDSTGRTGLAHMFEHMAFKGTPNIGTTDYAAESQALAAKEAAYQAYQAERLSPRPDPARLAQLESDFEARQQEASRFVVKNEFGDIVEREGGTGLNASTAADFTSYYYSLPANKVELFAYLESERFLHPVFREFYKERAVVQEERRMGVESRPIGRLLEQFLATAYVAHSYGVIGVGFMSDLESITATDAEAFFRTYYRPGNLVTAIVGDVHAESLVPLLDEYFGRVPPGPPPPPLRTVEPPQVAEKEVILEETAQPLYLEGYHRPTALGPDDAVYQAIDDVLSNGHTSRLYRSLVRDQKLAVFVQSFSDFPGRKYPGLWAVYAVPAPGVSNERVAAAIHQQLDRLEDEEVSDAELAKFKTRAKAGLLRSLGSNEGLADQLATYQQLEGDWRQLFRSLDRIEAVTKEDVQRVAREILRDPNRTVARIENAPPPAAAAAADGEAGR